MAVTKRNNATGKLKDQKNLSSKTHKKDDNINNSKKKGVTTDLHTLDILVALVRLFSFSSLFYIASTHVIALKNWPANAANKPFNTFEEFYPFYLTQHMDMTCRQLHVVGVSLVLLVALCNLRLLAGLLTALISGYATFNLTRHISHGIIEACVVLAVFLYSAKISKAGVWKAVGMLVIGYSFAWVGHFFFEDNTPATFVYPVFSLASDVRMWYEVLSQQIPCQ